MIQTLNTKTLISREEKVNNAYCQLSESPIIKIQAKAGQGKTVFAHLLSKKICHAKVYYQISDADKSPLHIVINLYHKLKDTLPDMASYELDMLIDQNSLLIFEYRKYCSLLIKAINNSKTKVTIIMDDLHLLPTEGLGYDAVRMLTEAVNDNLNLIICSRHNIDFKKCLNSFTVDESCLSLNEPEFMELSNIHLEWLHDFSHLDTVFKLCEGWIMGAIIAFKHMKDTSNASLSEFMSIDNIVDSYFFNTATVSKIDNTSTDIALLALLDDFHKDFINLQSNADTVKRHLSAMIEKNFFISQTEKDRYRLHHLYRENLRNILTEELNSKSINSFLRSAAEFEKTHNNLPQSIKYYIQADYIKGAEELVKENFLTLLSSTENSYIYEQLETTDISGMPWLNLFMGNYASLYFPDKPLLFYNNAKASAELSGDQLCSYLADAGMIMFHCYISGDFISANSIFSLLTDEYSEEGIPEVFQIMINNALSTVSLYASGRNDSWKFIEKCIQLNKSHGNFTTIANTNALMAMYGNFNSIPELQLESINKSCSFLNASSANTLTQTMDIALIMNYLCIFGHLYHFKGHISSFIESCPSFLIKVFGIFWLTDNMIKHEEYQEAATMIQNFLDQNPLPDHLSSQLEHNLASAMAHMQNPEALSMIESFLAKRSNSGANEYYTSLAYSFAATINAMFGKHADAVRYAEMALKEYNAPSLNSKNYITLSNVRHQQGNLSQAESYAVMAVKSLMEAGSTHSKGITSTTLFNTLSYASKHKETQQYAQEIAKSYNHFIDDQHQLKPMLEIRTLGSFMLKAGGAQVNPLEIPQIFKELLTSISQKDNYKCSVEDLLSTHWADTPASKQRSRFDANMSRLRSFLKKHLGIDPKNHIKIASGEACLVNTVVCEPEFCILINKAKNSYNKCDYMTSLINFKKAELILGAIPNNNIDSYLLTHLEYAMELALSFKAMFDGYICFDNFIDCYASAISHNDILTQRVIKHYKSKGNLTRSKELAEMLAGYE
jgi:ATP/maltotriose-dependent transcriptional regulator MalT